MSTETAIATTDDREAEGRRKLAILKAVGLDRAAPEQRELAIAIAKRYDLDLMLKHLVLIDGKPYVTRDALLWIAHRSGQFDGIEVTEPIKDADASAAQSYWRCSASVWRKDMSHAFTYSGRYPVTGQNAKFGPEMAVKVAESMALRRAFNISAPTQDERWDVEVPAVETEKPKTLAERVAEKAQEVQQADEQAGNDSPVVALSGEPDLPIPESALTTQAESAEVADGDFSDIIAGNPTGSGVHSCESKSPFGSGEQCRKESGHRGAHRASATETW